MLEIDYIYRQSCCAFKAAFQQLKEISFKITITLGGGVNINCIYYATFSKLLCLSFQISSLYQNSHMQIIVKTLVQNNELFNICNVLNDFLSNTVLTLLFL